MGDDRAAALAAIDRALATDPRDLRALIARADHMARDGDERGAAAFYRTAVRAAQASAHVPSELRREVERAAAEIARYGGQFEAYLLRALGAKGFRVDEGSRRFDESLGLMFGRLQVQLQRPKVYYFPGLPQVAFPDRAGFPWLGALEAAAPGIRAEAQAVLRDVAAFKPYVESSSERPRYSQEGMLDNPDWSAFYLWKYGEKVEANAARCPATMRAIEAIPHVHMANRSPTVLFSLLRAGAHIPPHHGMLNTRLIGHLPLIVPGGCKFRVGNEVREWTEGRAWLFDDTLEHEAWNRGAADRVILIFETWKPELTLEERALVCTMFDAVDEHSGEKPVWDI